MYNVLMSSDTPSFSGVPVRAGGENVGGIQAGGNNGDIVVARDLFLPWVTVLYYRGRPSKESCPCQGVWLLYSFVERLEEVCGGVVCCFMCVCLDVSATGVGNVYVNLPEVGYMLEESAGDKGTVFGDAIECVQGPQNIFPWCVAQVKSWCINDLTEGHPQSDLGGPLFIAKEDAG
jgi:hypothetical protein